MNRRTILKGILGAAASCFCPVLVKDLVQDLALPESFVECQKGGSYLLQLNCALEKVSGNGLHELRIKCGNIVIGQVMATIAHAGTTALQMTSTIHAILKEGDRLSAEYYLNGIRGGSPVAIDFHALHANDPASFVGITFVESAPGKELRVTID